MSFKPNPDVTLRPDLSVFSTEYLLSASQRGFITTDVLPIYSVVEQFGQYPKLPLKELLKIEDIDRAPDGSYNEISSKWTQDSYISNDRGLTTSLEDTLVAKHRRYIDAELVGIELLVDKILRGQEKKVADVVMNPSNAVKTVDAETAWSDLENCNPRADVQKAIDDMTFNTTGFPPNALVMSHAVFRLVSQCKSVLDYKSNYQIINSAITSGVEAKKAMLAAYFEIDRILVADAIYDKASKGKDTVFGSIWDTNTVSLMRVSSGGKMEEPAFGRLLIYDDTQTFARLVSSRAAGDLFSNLKIIIEQYRDEKHRNWQYRARYFAGEKVQYKGANYLITKVNPA